MPLWAGRVRRLVRVLIEEGRTERFFVATRAQDNGDYQVHRSGCRFLPTERRRQYIGSFDNGFHALKEARQLFVQSNGCASCSPEIHTK